VHVRSIRKKLGAARRMIETVRGVGYRFRDSGWSGSE
ncbi:MAG: winged helix-turn-helix domain-containing protein, partial [Planctomycetes bacterium]|nr:winged helix-turn-helix domain-containing protein [Planctomycetota bacterium]